MESSTGETGQALQAGIKATVVGAAVNILLTVLKIWVGLAGRSRALVADGVHSLSDLATDVVVVFGIIVGAKPRDVTHPYGHKRFETLSEVVVGLCLLGVAVLMSMDAVKALAGRSSEQPSAVALAIAALSVVSKEVLYRYTRRVSDRTGSRALLANAWHHRSDALSSLVVLASLALLKVYPPLWVLDPLACIGISVVIAKVAFDVSYPALRHIVDTAPEPGILERISAAATSHPCVLGIHKLRARYLGSQIIADLHIQVNPGLTVEQGHTIASEVEKSISRELDNIYDVTVHVEPAQPES
ncbi:MAG: cation transporter [Candidatus Glassbacteria bacterium]|nr:cation transporter [Candidatus Glassbacteria bacterium]